MTDDEFEAGIAVLISGVGKPMTREQIDNWRMFFSDMSFEDFKRGIVLCLRDYKYAGFPPIGLIRQAAGVSGGVPDADSTAVIAWERVLKMMREHGAYRSIEWDDPAIPAAIETVAGSWPNLCEQTSEQLHKFTSRQFMEAYRAIRSHGSAGETTSEGVIAEHSGRNGFALPDYTRAGDEPKRLYGFGGETVPALPSPASDVALALTFRPDAEADDEPEPEETADEFAQRKLRMLHELKVRFAGQA